MSVITLSIDGKDVAISKQVREFSAAASQVGIKIPALCHLDGVSEVAACRLCLVEIEGINKLLPACVTEVAEGMVVHTDTPKLKEYRRMTAGIIIR
jgi:bidirectional [NiFe] hydrogenase diaphorase subunit